VTGAWFPIKMLPVWLQAFAYVLPITSAIDLARACLNNAFALRHVFEFVYLLAVAFIFTEWALRSMRRRMVV
jgi:ABC-type multidrug transport system permease subunit